MKMPEPWTKDEIRCALLVRERLFSVPSEILEQDVILLDCPLDLIYLDRIDKPCVYYNHRSARPDTFMHDIMVRHGDPLRALAAEKDRQWKLRKLRELYSKPDVILSNSAFTRRMLNRYFGVDSYIVHPPVDLEKFSARSKPSRDFFLSVQRIHWQKRIETQIRAFTGIKEKLIIVGGGETEGSKKIEMLDYVVNDIPNIEYPGRVKEQKLIYLLQNAKATIQTGYKEDFGLVPIESMACGTPCIVVDEGGFKETIHSPQLGIRIKPPYVENLRKAVQNFESSRYDPAILRREAEKYGLKRFKKQMEKYIRLAVEIHNGIHS